MNHPRVHIPDHAVLRHLTGILRAENSPMPLFRQTANRISRILTVYATSTLPEESYKVKTPLAECTQHRIVNRVIACPILRAGLSMLDAFLDLHPDSSVFHIGLKRDEQTHQPVAYYRNFDDAEGEARVFLLDPMLATGGSLSYACAQLKQAGYSHLSVIAMIASPEGITRLLEDHPDIHITVATVDERLNDDAFIVPGLGDAGDRYFGT